MNFRYASYHSKSCFMERAEADISGHDAASGPTLPVVAERSRALADLRSHTARTHNRLGWQPAKVELWSYFSDALLWSRISFGVKILRNAWFYSFLWFPGHRDPVMSHVGQIIGNSLLSKAFQDRLGSGANWMTNALRHFDGRCSVLMLLLWL